MKKIEVNYLNKKTPAQKIRDYLKLPKSQSYIKKQERKAWHITEKT